MKLSEKIDTELRKRNLERFNNKYLIVSVLFFILIAFIDQNNLTERMANLRELHQLEEDKAYYVEKIEEVTARLEELRTDKDNLEKFAREQYKMKKDDEDIFVIIEE